MYAIFTQVPHGTPFMPEQLADHPETEAEAAKRAERIVAVPVLSGHGTMSIIKLVPDGDRGTLLVIKPLDYNSYMITVEEDMIECLEEIQRAVRAAHQMTVPFLEPINPPSLDTMGRAYAEPLTEEQAAQYREDMACVAGEDAEAYGAFAQVRTSSENGELPDVVITQEMIDQAAEDAHGSAEGYVEEPKPASEAHPEEQPGHLFTGADRQKHRDL